MRSCVCRENTNHTLQGSSCLIGVLDVYRYASLFRTSTIRTLIRVHSEFFKEYQLDCPYAMERLVKYGVPATVLHRNVDERDQIGRARQAAETVSTEAIAGYTF